MAASDPMHILEEALATMSGTYTTTPYVRSYVDDLLERLRSGDHEENPSLFAAQCIADLISLLQFFELRLNALEHGEPAPR